MCLRVGALPLEARRADPVGRAFAQPLRHVAGEMGLGVDEPVAELDAVAPRAAHEIAVRMPAEPTDELDQDPRSLLRRLGPREQGVPEVVRRPGIQRLLRSLADASSVAVGAGRRFWIR